MPKHQPAGELSRARGRMKRVAIMGLSLFSLTSCVNSMGGKEDQQRIAGVYVLDRVDGAAIPASIAPLAGCNRTVQKGIFRITAGGSEVRPTYDWTISIDADCQPVPPSVLPGDGDVGAWRFQHSTQLSFSSMMDHGSYSASLEESTGNPPAITFVNLGNSYRFVRVMRWDDPQGYVNVSVVDQSGQPVPGVLLVFTFANGIQGGGTTPASGEFTTGGVVGECWISITAPAGYAVPASQPNPLSVSVVEGPTIQMQITLTKT
jgi:hypothetical protein